MHFMVKDLDEWLSTVTFGSWPPSNGVQLSEGRPMTTLVRDLRLAVRVPCRPGPFGAVQMGGLIFPPL